MAGGIIHKPMFERLILCEYAIADLTTANANVFYELGLRHAVRPASTMLLFAKDTGQIPFDLAPLRSMSYEITADGTPGNLVTAIAALTERLNQARAQLADSPVYQQEKSFPDI